MIVLTNSVPKEKDARVKYLEKLLSCAHVQAIKMTNDCVKMKIATPSPQQKSSMDCWSLWLRSEYGILLETNNKTYPSKTEVAPPNFFAILSKFLYGERFSYVPSLFRLVEKYIKHDILQNMRKKVREFYCCEKSLQNRIMVNIQYIRC